MTFSKQQELAEALVIKKAGLDDILQSIEQYKAFNVEDSWDAAPITAGLGGLGGALAGAGIGGGRAIINKLFGNEEEEEEDGILKKTLRGAGIGGLAGGALGGISPLLVSGSLPHLSRLYGKKQIHNYEDARDAGHYKGKPLQRILDRMTAESQEPLTNTIAPHLSIRNMLDIHDLNNNGFEESNVGQDLLEQVRGAKDQIRDEVRNSFDAYRQGG